MSIVAEPAVAVVERAARHHGTFEVAGAYLEYLYSPEGQEIAARHYYRPRLEAIEARYRDRFPRVQLFTVDELFGSFQAAQRTHFRDGGVFDQLCERGR